MKIAAYIITGVLFAAGIMLGSAWMNRQWAAAEGTYGFRGIPRDSKGLMSISYANPEDVKISQMSNLASKPPIDADVPSQLESAVFSLG